jgi:hypothetical protein
MNDNPISPCEDPQHCVATHPITLELTKRGITEEQLAAIRFRGRNRELPFDQWSFTWGNDMPPQAIPFIRPYCALKWLILDNPTYSRDKEDAWRYLNDIMIAPLAALGLKHKKAQKRRAQQSRGRVTDDGQTIKQIVERLVRSPEHTEKSTRDLWPPFFAVLDELDLDPKEVMHSDRRKQRYEYLFGDTRRKISYGQFANLVCEIRPQKSG